MSFCQKSNLKDNENNQNTNEKQILLILLLKIYSCYLLDGMKFSIPYTEIQVF